MFVICPNADTITGIFELSISFSILESSKFLDVDKLSFIRFPILSIIPIRKLLLLIHPVDPNSADVNE